MKKKYDENDIRVVTAREAVRLRPQIYFEKIFEAGNLNLLPVELACHAFDEYFDGNCSTLEVTVSNDHFSIKYDAGMSLTDKFGDIKALNIMTQLFACRSDKKHLLVGEEFCELGMATVNFASEYCILNTVWQGKSGYFKFERGVLIEQKLNESAREEFTEITLKPDAEIFGELAVIFVGVESILKESQKKLDGLELIIKVAE